jgi:integrase/recombinase XerD
MQSDKSCKIVEQYLAYLVTIKGRSRNTILEYRLDLLQFFKYVASTRGEDYSNFQFVNIDFIRSISLGEMYGFLAYCQDTLHASHSTRTRKIVSIRQLWKYLRQHRITANQASVPFMIPQNGASLLRIYSVN